MPVKLQSPDKFTVVVSVYPLALRMVTTPPLSSEKRPCRSTVPSRSPIPKQRDPGELGDIVKRLPVAGAEQHLVEVNLIRTRSCTADAFEGYPCQGPVACQRQLGVDPGAGKIDFTVPVVYICIP